MKKEPEKKYGWGGARPNSGRRKSTGKDNVTYITLNMRVREATVDALRESAEREEISLSKKANEVLTAWANGQAAQPDPDPDALAAAVNRLADVIEKIVNRNEED